MPQRLSFTSVAARQIGRLDPPVRGRLERALAAIAREPLAGKPLRGPLLGRYSYRMGDWRIIYRIEVDEVLIEVVAHRSQAYR